MLILFLFCFDSVFGSLVWILCFASFFLILLGGFFFFDSYFCAFASASADGNGAADADAHADGDIDATRSVRSSSTHSPV